MKIQNLLAAGSILAACAFGTTAAVAAPIDLGGYVGPVTIDFSNFENFTSTQVLSNGVTAPGNNSQNAGTVFIVKDVDNEFSQDILNTSQYTYVGVFYGITTTSATPFTDASGTGFNADTTGGTFVLYQVPNADINLATVISQGSAGYTSGTCTALTEFTCYNGITNVTGGTDVLEWSLGTNSLNPTYTLLNGSGKVVNTGSASGDGTVSGGADASQFAPDISVEDDFCTNDGLGTAQCGKGLILASNPANSFEELSNDPVSADAIPEPASLALIGSQLIGLGAFVGWRRKRRAAQAEAL